MRRYRDKLTALPGQQTSKPDDIGADARQQTALREAAGIKQPVIPAPPPL